MAGATMVWWFVWRRASADCRVWLGDVRLANFLETHRLTPTLKSEVDAVAATIGDVYGQSQNLLHACEKWG